MLELIALPAKDLEGLKKGKAGFVSDLSSNVHRSVLFSNHFLTDLERLASILV
jgi:hypothetical protein